MMKLVNINNLNEVIYSLLYEKENNVAHKLSVEITGPFHTCFISTINITLYNPLNIEIYEELKNELNNEIT
jgi:hypothetical protein